MSIFGAALENMKAATMDESTVSTDLTEDGVAVDVIPEDPDAIVQDQAELDESVMLITSMSKDLDMFGNVGELASTEGLHPQTMRLIDPDNLMHTTIVGWPSVESLNGQLLPASSPDMASAIAGLEQFYGAATEGFFEAIGNFASKIGRGAVNFIQTGFASLTGMFGRGAKGGIDENAKVPDEKSGGVSLKMVLVAIGAIIAVAAVVLKIMGKPLPISKEALQAWKTGINKEATAAVKEVGGEVAENGAVKFAPRANFRVVRKFISGKGRNAGSVAAGNQVAKDAAAANVAAAKEMGWTANALKQVRDKLNAASKAVTDSLTKAKNWVTNGAKEAKGVNPLTAERAAQAAEAGASSAAGATGEAVKKGFFSKIGEKFIAMKDAIVYGARIIWTLIKNTCSRVWSIVKDGYRTAKRAFRVARIQAAGKGGLLNKGGNAAASAAA